MREYAPSRVSMCMPDKVRAVWSGKFALAMALAALAGWVDATAYVRLAHVYVSFMSGNSTVLATSIPAWHSPKLALIACVLGSFVAGVVVGEIIAVEAARRAHMAVLFAEALLLFAGAGAALVPGSRLLPAALLALALGTQNASVHGAGGVSVAITYVTGTLVKLGRAIAAALAGKGRWAEALPYLLLWLGLIAGAALGAAVAHVNATLAIALVGTVALGLACVVGFAMKR
ncbi:MAG: YoaK family protein [Rhizomicrobium sp.]